MSADWARKPTTCTVSSFAKAKPPCGRRIYLFGTLVLEEAANPICANFIQTNLIHISEGDYLNPIKKWNCQCLAKDMVKRLNNKHYNAMYADNADEAKRIVIDMIEEGASVCMGGSVTLMDMDMINELRKPKYKFFDRFNQPSWDAIVETFRQSFLADYLVTSTNAITKNGELVFTDSGGNRAAGVILGPKKVIIVAGVNKIVDNLDDAFKRIRRIAPINVKRIGHNAPCTVTGICEDCDCDDRACNYTSIIHNGRKFKDRITVIMVADELGY